MRHHDNTGTGRIADRGIAWVPSGTRLYVLTRHQFVSTPPPAVLHIYSGSIVDASII